MNRKELIDMIENGTTIVRSFIIENDSSSDITSSYENWNNGDVVCHIVGWMNYSIDKLSCIKLGKKQSDEYSQITSLDEINKILYNKSKNKNREDIETDYLNSIGSYIKVISLFTNIDINLNTFDTGFKMELWRYMIMDTVIHPIQHIIYQYLKKKEYNKIPDVIKNSEDIFDKYSEGKTAYKLSEFEIDRAEYQDRLKYFEEEYNDNKYVKNFVQINRKRNA